MVKLAIGKACAANRLALSSFRERILENANQAIELVKAGLHSATKTPLTTAGAVQQNQDLA
ncbi:MAG: hypothetical protein ACAF41_08185 [Leptolyngbya sp. BL-A-14]